MLIEFIPHEYESVLVHSAYLIFAFAAAVFWLLLWTRYKWDADHKYGWLLVLLVGCIDLLGVAMLGDRMNATETAWVLFVVLGIQGLVGSVIYYQQRRNRVKANNGRNFKE